ncbi:four-helix bundle copper-binding protein [Hymenobacter jejuensis]|uniref:Four-helix bundle copper-binding protein n=1 Tax=Hymenobacter jejuensis TaxID=2502781 RepID=A0A5B8A613_9BACT|nr:four-helix bundle copper-binding protein [Hymenobacter jejuensis]QDA61682.1 four-helix bundle copper-binding protein [Hymenobacter jejuensis]
MNQPTAPNISTKLDHTILSVLNRCVAACENCATSCLQEPHVQMMVQCILLDRDCADICALTARLVARHSPHAKHVMRECVEVCRLCYDECSKHQHEHCQKCAEACKACADACKSYLL